MIHQFNSGTENIHHLIKGNVYKGKNDLGETVWHCIDWRECDTFECDTYPEAKKTFINNWDNLTIEQQNQAFYNSNYYLNSLKDETLT